MEKQKGKVVISKKVNKSKLTDQNLPPFPEEGKESRFSPGGEIEIEVPNLALSEELIEICKDIISVPFEVWSILKPSVKPLSEAEKGLISKPLARIVVKYDVAKFMKDELLLVAFLGFSILKRIKAKENVVDDSRKEGKGKDDAGEAVDNREHGILKGA